MSSSGRVHFAVVLPMFHLLSFQLLSVVACGVAFGLIPIAARASRSNTPEIFYQPNVGQMDFSGEYHQQLSGSTTVSSGGVTTDTIQYANTGYGLGLGYAFSEAWAIQISAVTDTFTTTVTDTSNTSTTASAAGLEDLAFMLTNITPIGGWSLYVGVGAGLSPANHLDANLGGAAGNNATGGTSVINYLGLSTTVGSGNYLGVKLQYITRLSRTGNTNGSPGIDYSQTGGNDTNLQAFYEMDFTPFAIDLTGGYTTTDAALKTYSDSSTASVVSTNHAQASLGMQYDITAGTNFRLQYTYAVYPSVASTGAASYNATFISARLRFEF